MKKVWLIRHGETQYNAENRIQGCGIDAPLNNKGITQAQQMAIAMNKLVEGSVSIYSSNMLRAKQTASFLADVLGQNSFDSESLKEMNYGVFEGRLFDEVEAELKDLIDDWDKGLTTKKAMQGESPQQVLDRSSSFILNELKNSTTDNLIFVIHGRVIRILLAWFLDQDLSTMQKYPHHNANISLLHYNQGIFSSVYINKTDHLLAI